MANGAKKVLVVEDESAIRNLLNLALSSAGFEVLEAPNAEAGWQKLMQETIDVVLLDQMLPGMSGEALLQRMRQKDETRAVPVIMVTAKGEEQDQVSAFEQGADDYVVKPFSPKALVARVQAVLRRTQPMSVQDSEAVLRFGELYLDTVGHRFKVGEDEVHVGPTEFRLMHALLKHPDRALSREQLLEMVWGDQVVVEARTVDVHIRRLRKLLQPLQAEGYIQTVRGAGYRLSTP